MKTLPGVYDESMWIVGGKSKEWLWNGSGMSEGLGCWTLRIVPAGTREYDQSMNNGRGMSEKSRTDAHGMNVHGVQSEELGCWTLGRALAGKHEYDQIMSNV